MNITEINDAMIRKFPLGFFTVRTNLNRLFELKTGQFVDNKTLARQGFNTPFDSDLKITSDTSTATIEDNGNPLFYYLIKMDPEKKVQRLPWIDKGVRAISKNGYTIVVARRFFDHKESTFKELQAIMVTSRVVLKPGED